MKIRSLIEKPSKSKAPSNLGLLEDILPYEIFSLIKKLPRWEMTKFNLTDALNLLIGTEKLYLECFLIKVKYL